VKDKGSEKNRKEKRRGTEEKRKEEKKIKMKMETN